MKSKVIILAMAMAGISMPAFADEVPAPKLALPLGAQTEIFYGAVSIVWGYNPLHQNAETMEGTVLFPDGTERTVKGMISDANGSEVRDPEATGKPTEHNSLLYRNILGFDTPSMDGIWSVTVPAATVLIEHYDEATGDTVSAPNPEVTLYWQVGDGTTGLSAPAAASDGEPVYYDFSGRRVVSPVPGAAYIRIDGSSASKVVVRE